MPVISVTRVRIRSWRYLPAFLLQSTRIFLQAMRADGNLSVKFLRDRQKTFWTVTSWASEASMLAFVRAQPHGPAMRSLLDWCDEAAQVHWTQVDATPLSWTEAHKRILEEGRRSKVNHPSEAHTFYTIAAPATGRFRELHLK